MTAPAGLDPGALPEPSRGDRWQPLRAGVVNLWEFDVAEYWLAGGRAQFVGQNQSGKSTLMALTSLILLAGDLDRQLVDTFGQEHKAFRYYVEPTGDPQDRRESGPATSPWLGLAGVRPARGRRAALLHLPAVRPGPPGCHRPGPDLGRVRRAGSRPGRPGPAPGRRGPPAVPAGCGARVPHAPGPGPNTGPGWPATCSGSPTRTGWTRWSACSRCCGPRTWGSAWTQLLHRPDADRPACDRAGRGRAAGPGLGRPGRAGPGPRPGPDRPATRWPATWLRPGTRGPTRPCAGGPISSWRRGRAGRADQTVAEAGRAWPRPRTGSRETTAQLGTARDTLTGSSRAMRTCSPPRPTAATPAPPPGWNSFSRSRRGPGGRPTTAPARPGSPRPRWTAGPPNGRRPARPRPAPPTGSPRPPARPRPPPRRRACPPGRGLGGQVSRPAWTRPPPAAPAGGGRAAAAGRGGPGPAAGGGRRRWAAQATAAQGRCAARSGQAAAAVDAALQALSDELEGWAAALGETHRRPRSGRLAAGRQRAVRPARAAAGAGRAAAEIWLTPQTAALRERAAVRRARRRAAAAPGPWSGTSRPPSSCWPPSRSPPRPAAGPPAATAPGGAGRHPAVAAARTARQG